MAAPSMCQSAGDSTEGTIPSLVTNWKLCCLCQENTNDKLTCPAGNGYESVYKTLSENLTKFDEISDLPFPMNIKRLDDGSGIENTLLKNKAVIHGNCRRKCNAQKLERAKKRASVKSECSSENVPSPKKTRSSFVSSFNREQPQCILCDSESQEKLIKASTDDIDTTFRNLATKANNSQLIARLASAVDMHAMDAYYHKSCHTKLYTLARSAERHAASVNSRSCGNDSSLSTSLEAIAFAELAAYVSECKGQVFKLRELYNLYDERLTQLGCTSTSTRNSTRLKERLMQKLPGLTTQPAGRDVLITHTGTVGSAMTRR